ncbi:MAG TPA: DoxX family protein [Proteus sp.]|nr:DoxX family protein [Proteus sp. (in: enterobacteria)]
MPNSIARILESQTLWFIARILILLLFISSAFTKVFDYENSLAEMRAAGLNPDWFFNIATVIILFSSSFLVLFESYLWLGAGALAVFLFLTIVIVHTFWNMTGDVAMLSIYFAIEHISVIGGLMATAIASHFRALWKRTNV